MINTSISKRKIWGQEIIIFCAMFVLTMLHEWMFINSFENFLKGLTFFVILYAQAQYHRFFIFRFYLLKKYLIYIIYSLVVIFLGTSILFTADLLWIQPEFVDPNEPAFSFLYHFVICIISTVTIMALSLMQRYAMELQRRNLDQILLNEMRLKSLHAQLNPHFFFNMLNNLYGVSLAEPERTPDLIVKLSNLMRYQIENGNVSKVSLMDEITFIRNYIDLERERIGKRCDIQFECKHCTDEINSFQIPPLLLIILVENSFKHSQNFNHWFVHINIAVKHDNLHIAIENSLADKTLQKNSTNVGLNNLQQRLSFIYKSDYSLNENKTAFSYQTTLILPLEKNHMKVLNCIIVDDEEGAHLVLKHFIQQSRHLKLNASFYTAVEAMEYLYNHNIDVLFLDINMPGLTGMELLEAMSNKPFIVLTTAYKEYALESYKYEVVDYLVKPFDFKSFLSAVDKVINRINFRNRNIDQPPREPEHIILKIENQIVKLPCDSIHYTQSYGNYVKFFTAEKVLLSQITTQEVENKLNKDHFVRIHKSYLVSLREVSKISGGELILKDGTVLPIGKFYKKNLIDILNS